jgi:thioredoxin reductase (NADPH)
LLAQIEHHNIRFLPQTAPIEITPAHVNLAHLDENGEPTGEKSQYPTDFVLLSTGFRADMSLFERAGVTLLGLQRTPKYNPGTMETDVPGLYVAGTAAAGSQKRYTLFIENCHVHVGKIVAALTGNWPDKIGTIPERQYELPFEEFQDN